MYSWELLDVEGARIVSRRGYTSPEAALTAGKKHISLYSPSWKNPSTLYWLKVYDREGEVVAAYPGAEDLAAFEMEDLEELSPEGVLRLVHVTEALLRSREKEDV